MDNFVDKYKYTTEGEYGCWFFIETVHQYLMECIELEHTRVYIEMVPLAKQISHTSIVEEPKQMTMDISTPPSIHHRKQAPQLQIEDAVLETDYEIIEIPDATKEA